MFADPGFDWPDPFEKKCFLIRPDTVCPRSIDPFLHIMGNYFLDI